MSINLILVIIDCAALIFLGFCIWVWRAWSKPGLVDPEDPRNPEEGSVIPFVPTEPGYYWATGFDARKVLIVEVFRYRNGDLEVQCPGDEGCYKLDSFRFLSGPLRPPPIDDPRHE